MKNQEKIIRNWRMQVAAPFGVHLWFDPSVESVVLLDEPTGFLEVEEEKKICVDKPVIQAILGKYSSVSGQAGGAEGGDRDNLVSGGQPDRLPAEPLGFQEDFDAT